jgi:integrase
MSSERKRKRERIIEFSMGWTPINFFKPTGYRGSFDGQLYSELPLFWENPVRSVDRIDEPLNRIRFLSEDEELVLLNEAAEPLRTIILVGIYAGLRIQSEALTLRVEHVDLKCRILTVEAAYAKNKETQDDSAAFHLDRAILEIDGKSPVLSTTLFTTPEKSALAVVS